MTAKFKRRSAASAIALLIALHSPVQAEEPGVDTTQLPDVNVQGKKNPLEESDRRLRELLDKSTPCMGCDAKKPEVPPSLLDKVIDTAVGLVTPQASKPLDHDDDMQRDVDRADYERRHSSNSNP